MKISEVINDLELIMHKHGDVTVYHKLLLSNDSGVYGPPVVVFDGVDAVIE